MSNEKDVSKELTDAVNKVLSRRDAVKKAGSIAAGAALAFLGLSMPGISQQKEARAHCTICCDNQCFNTCWQECYENCADECYYSCIGTCEGGCDNGCDSWCQFDCIGGCTGTCEGTCGMTCTGADMAV